MQARTPLATCWVLDGGFRWWVYVAIVPRLKDLKDHNFAKNCVLYKRSGVILETKQRKCSLERLRSDVNSEPADAKFYSKIQIFVCLIISSKSSQARKVQSCDPFELVNLIGELTTITDITLPEENIVAC